MNEYKIELTILSESNPDWIIQAIEDKMTARCQGNELIKYFDYTIKPIEDKTS